MQPLRRSLSVSPSRMLPGTSSPFGPAVFSTSWNTGGRERGNTSFSAPNPSTRTD
ncbi:hypothetical protein F5Y17DRAFT_430806 [Xylariaceae sp. FL0594]|nr:hypothetical protein F5Y17DRAFT_430806 [Xylariaceae sp. FL0594]